MGTVFLLLALLLLVQSALSWLASLRFARYALTSHTGKLPRNQPKVAVIIPCRGWSGHGEAAHLEENLRAFFRQDYRDYELFFVVESERDPAHALLSKIIKQSRRSAWLLVAGEAVACGQKVHNLLTALETLDSFDRRVEVLVFADADAQPAPHWLAELVAPLHDRSIGATTGFRWYVPTKQGGAGPWSAWLTSAWNASALGLLGERSGFAWGGSTAILRENFNLLALKDHWQGTLSDDYILTSVLKRAEQRIKFVPACLVVTHAAPTLAELLEFTTRQMRITRVYAPRVWQFTALSQGLFNFTFWGGWLWCLASLGRNSLTTTLTVLLLGIAVLGAATAWLRATVAAKLLANETAYLLANRWRYALCAPLVPLIYFYNLVASVASRRIVWRGIGYEMITPQTTVIWQRTEHATTAAEIAPRVRKQTARVRSS